jgi:hypothetical protein
MAERKFTDLELERSLAGDLPPARAKELEASATPDDRTRLEQLRTEHHAFLASVDLDDEVRRIQQRRQRILDEVPRRAAWWRWLAPAGALAAAAAVVLLILRRRDDIPPGDELQVKGDAITLVVHLAGADGSRRLETGDTVQAGDRIRFEVNALRKGYVTVIGVDGSGATTVYHPFNGDAPAPYDPGAKLLAGAIQLDATPGDEKFFAFFSEKPFAIATVLPAVKGAAVPSDVSAADVMLHKTK